MKALVVAFSVIVKPIVKPMEHYTALVVISVGQRCVVMSEYIEGVLQIVPCSGRGGIQFTRECSADDIIHSSQ